MLSLNLKQLFVAGVTAGLLSVGFSLLSHGTALAADYPGSQCQFNMSGDESYLAATCTDSKSNGSFDGERFQGNGKGQYSFTDTFWSVLADARSGTRHYSHTQINSDYSKTSCKPAVVEVKNNKATISGQYAAGPGGNSRGFEASIKCVDLLKGEVPINRESVRLDTWQRVFRENFQENLLKSACDKLKGAKKKECQDKVKQAVNECVGPGGSVWATAVTGTKKEVRKAYKDNAVTCVQGKIGALASRSAIEDAATKASNTATKAEEEVVDTVTEEPAADETSCDVDGVGYFVCPIMSFMGRLNDESLKFLSNFLLIEPELLQDDGTRKAWGTFRDIANIAFVIAFMIIVYSQITGAWVSNYGIKRLLPKLVIAAILVNASYIVCQLAVDLSNIVGSNIYQLLGTGLVPGVAPAGTGGEGAWEHTIGWVLTGLAFVTLVIVVFLAPSVLLAFAMVLLILVARQAAAVLLIIVSPLAFVAYLLPNTEQWFKKWWKMFVAILMVFPIIGLVFGASTLASQVLLNIASSDGNVSGFGDMDDDKQMLALVALGVQAIPLFAVPMLLKGSLGALGSVGARIASYQDKANARGKKGIKEGRIGEFTTAQKRAQQLRGARVRQSRFNPMRRLDRGRLGKITGGDRGAAAALSAITEDFNKDKAHAVEAQKDIGFSEREFIAQTGLRAMRNSDGSLMKDASGKIMESKTAVSAAERTAAIDYMMENGNFGERQKLLASAGNIKGDSFEDKKMLQAMEQGYYKTGMNNVHGSAFGDVVAQGGLSGKSSAQIEQDLEDATVKSVIDADKMKPEIFTDGMQADYMAKLAAKPGRLDAAQLAKVHGAAVAAETNQTVYAKLNDKGKNAINDIKQLVGSPPSTGGSSGSGSGSSSGSSGGSATGGTGGSGSGPTSSSGTPPPFTFGNRRSNP